MHVIWLMSLLSASLGKRKLLIIIFYGVNLTLATAGAVALTIAFDRKKQCLAECSSSNANDPTIASIFVLISIWAFLFTVVLFVLWAVHQVQQAYKGSYTAGTKEHEETGTSLERTSAGNTNEDIPEENEIEAASKQGQDMVAKYLFQICLPLTLTVTVGYLAYIFDPPEGGHFNSNACYTWISLSSFPKDAGKSLAQYMLFAEAHWSIMAHLFCSPFLLFLFIGKEYCYRNPWPLSTMIIVLLSVAVSLVHKFVGRVYCVKDMSIVLLQSCALNLGLHCFFYFFGQSRTISCFGKGKRTVGIRNAHNDMSHESSGFVAGATNENNDEEG